MAETIESPAVEPEQIDPKQVELVSYWLQQMEDACKREKEWRKEAKEVQDLYEACKKTSFNILYSNTETLMPALYSATPKPAVVRRIKTEPTPIASVAADLLNKSLTWTLDTNDEDYSEFDVIMSNAVLSALVPGRGQAWFNYDAKFVEVDSDDVEELKERDTPGDDPDESKKLEKVVDENVCPEIVPWDQFLMGYAKTWKQVPWVARCYTYTKTDIDKMWPDKSRLIKYVSVQEIDNADEKSLGKDSSEYAGAPMVTTVYQIWDKTTRKVYHVCSGYPFSPLEDPVEDPLKLSGFFPCPEPLTLVRKLTDMVPKTLYKFYREQALELEEVTVRLRGLIKAMRIRGMYSALVDDIAKVLDADENTMIPITNSAALNDKALSNAIFLVPIHEYVPVIQELWNQRQQIKQVIYEVTGISDIIRGSTVASETATAQDIKNRWGTLRLQDMQKRVQKFSRNCMRIMAEIMSNQYDAEKWQACTGVQLMTAAEKQKIQEALQQHAAQAMPGPDGQPAPPPQLPPEIQKAMELPTWDEVIGFLRDKVLRQYRIDIETDSTLADDVKQDKAELAEIMTGLTQMVQSLTAAVASGMLPFDAAKSLLHAFVSRFRIGAEVEQVISQMKQPPPQDDEAKKLELQQKNMEMQQKQKEGDQKMQMEAFKFQKEQELAEMEMQLKREEHRMRMAEMNLKHQLEMSKLGMQQQQMVVKSQLEERRGQQQLLQSEQQHQMALQQGQMQAEQQTTAHQQSMEAGQQKADLGNQQFKQKQQALKQQQKAVPSKPKGDK